ncbi:MAG: hypothetical protein WC279_05860 [Sulfurimonas sp.]|jgi:hypothetical protein|uniref:hypothetical protein n=1 Tax=Sulfurimonas sp. TaxID=2022749 RepID=UPI001BBDD90C|nr:hypothetical protein [Sulfurimonas sp.]
MIKINTTQTIIDDFYNSVVKLFENKLKKTEKKKLLWEIELKSIDKLLAQKLKNFDEHVTFEKIIKADYPYMKNLVEFLDKHPQRYALSPQEKDYFLTMYDRLKKADFIKQLNINVCPYCNRNYIFNFSKNNQQEATAQLDHFFDKKDYPYLAVSIYNLVPSCSTCNQRKSSKRENIFYPYLESFNESAKFRYKGIKPIAKDENIDFLDSKRVMFDIEAIKDKKKVEKHIEVFNLKNLYEEHKDIVAELLQKKEIYNDSYIDELMQKYEGTLFKNREDLLRLVTCGYVSDDDLHKRPLSKLIKDISEELNLI